jgi:small ligand-binding sensory domain FIST
MRSAAALSTHPIASHATGDVIADILDLGDGLPDLAIVFATSAFSGAAEDILRTVKTILQPTRLLFVASSGVLGAGSEVSSGAALSLWTFWSESVEEVVTFVRLDEGVDALDYFSTRLLANAATLIVLGDPSLPMVTQTVDSLCELSITKNISGGLLTGSSGAPLLRDGNSEIYGCVAIALDTSDAQATLAHRSSSISRTMTVTRSVGSMVCEVDGAVALDVAYDALSQVPSEERSRTATRLALAVHDSDSATVIDVHEVLGADRESGALAIAAVLPAGTVVSFHRIEGSDSFAGLDAALGGPTAAGALLFTCLTIDPEADREGVSDLGPLTESLGTAAYAGVHVATAIGPGSSGPGLSAAPLSAVIFGRRHH